VATAGDVDADGFDDVIVGAPSNHEKVYLYLGSASGPSSTANWTVDGNLETTLLGKSVGSAGDVNADGFSDVFIGAPVYSSAAHWDGRAFVYTGSASGLPAEPSWIGEGHASQPLGLQYGASIASAGDVNGDGCDDLVVGARNYDVLGRAFLYQGAACNDLGSRYCSAETNSTGLPADIFASGSASASTGNLTLFAANVPIRFGLFFHGSNQTQIVFGNGYLCTTDHIARGVVIQPPEFLASYTYDGSDAKHSLAGHVGSTRHFQYWFRDMFGAHFDTSNAISILIQP
jgi:hypothetical protein